MADISILSRLINGVQRNVDLSANTLVLSSLKLGTSELTKAKLDLLAITTDSPTAVDASAQHHHDGRYYTQSQLGSTTDGSSGASLVGVDQVPAFANISGANVQTILESIDTALNSAGGSVFLDNVFRIQDNADNTKELAFELSGITTGTLRTITMPDTNVDLGQIATNTSNISTNTSNIALKANTADVVLRDGTQAFTGNQSMGSNKLTDLAAPTADNDAARKIDVDTAQAGLKVKDPVDVVADTNITLSGEQTIDGVLTSTSRVLVAGQTTASENGIYVSAAGAWARATDFDGTPSGEVSQGNIVLVLSGTSNTNTHYVLNTTDAVDPTAINVGTDTMGWAIYSRAEAITASTGLTKVGLDIRLADVAAANGIAVSSGAISISLATDPGLEFASGLLRVLVDPAGALERVAAGLDVKNLGIDSARLAATSVIASKLGADVAGDGLSGGNGAAIAFDATATAGVGLENDGSNNHRIAASAYDQVTITGGAGASASVQYAPKIEEIMTAGESFAANSSFLVRMALSGETAGRIYKASNPAGSAGSETNTIYVIGLAQNRTGAIINAGSTIPVVKWGNATLQSSDTAFTASQDEGLPVYLGASGAFTLTAPTATDTAVVKVGTVRNVGGASAIEMSAPQIMGINA